VEGKASIKNLILLIHVLSFSVYFYSFYIRLRPNSKNNQCSLLDVVLLRSGVEGVLGKKTSAN